MLVQLRWKEICRVEAGRQKEKLWQKKEADRQKEKPWKLMRRCVKVKFLSRHGMASCAAKFSLNHNVDSATMYRLYRLIDYVKIAMRILDTSQW